MSGSRDDRDRDDAADHLKQGIGHLWRAARSAASGIKREVDRGGLGKTIDDAGRELVRAATNVVGRLGAEIQKLDPEDRSDPHGAQGAHGAPAPWPTTRDEYERKYGAIDGEWPKTPEEYTHRFGQPPAVEKPRGPTPDDPGFTIQRDRDDEPR